MDKNNIYYFFIFITTFSGYSFIDHKLGNLVEGKYYLIHSVHNAFMIYLTINDVYNTYFDFFDYVNQTSSLTCGVMTLALHIYHIFMYFNKLRFIDWIHHILMLCICLPVAFYYRFGSLLGHSIFYICGLPGCIDYMLLFLERNKGVNRMTEKKVNVLLNVWIRSPGCNIHSLLSLIVLSYEYQNISYIGISSILLTSSLIYWNGNYFMKEAVIDYTRNELIKKVDKTI